MSKLRDRIWDILDKASDWDWAVSREMCADDGLDREEATDAIMALIESEKAEKEALREAAKAVLRAVDSAKMVETGAGGMTIESQLMRSVYQRVPALPFEWLRAALGDT